MMTLITGQPGHGKSAYAVTRILDFVKEGRAVYVHGIKNFDHERAGTLHLEDPTKWQDLPDGSVVVLDECYSAFPNRNPGAKVPDHVGALATHRHRGFDFLFLAQQSIQIDPFMKGLFEEHIHVKKKFARYRKLLRWSSFQSNVKALCTDAQDWLLPSYPFNYFTSTVLNTSRNRIPKWLVVVAASIAVVGGLAMFAKHRLAERTAKAEQPAAEQGAAAPFGSRGTSGAVGVAAPRERYPTVVEYAKAHLPRFAMMPWTAPIYDERPVVSEPELICASSDAGRDANGKWQPASCSCITEQATRYDISLGECRTLARQGGVYNPYKRHVEAPAASHAVASMAGPADAGPAAPVRVTGTSTPFGSPPEDSGTFALDPAPANPGGSL